tara:strand:+ start:4326 stop:5042 length:717 start_codon:yes stop_codon:yes gene_type:complete
MSLKKVALAAALSSFPITQAFGAEVSGNIALTTDYKFRGISQSDSAPSVQGGFDIAFDNGAYIGTWGAAVDFDCAIDTCGGLNGGIELDYYAGFASDISDSVSFDIGYIYYDYPQDEGLLGDYGEIYGSLSFGDFGIGMNYSDEYWGETGKFTYTYATYSTALSESVALDLLVGSGDYDEAGYLDGATEHMNWSVALSTSAGGLDFAITYEDTDLDKEDAYGYDWADAALILSIGKSL